MKVGVVTFPGTLDDQDAARAIRLAGGEPVALWHASDDLHAVDAVVLPGGFSYGDYLRCGAIAALAPAVKSIVEAAHKGMPVLGICNGFQVLCESHLLPGALIRNEHQRFICREQELVVENASTAFTYDFEQGERIVIPLKNGEGNFQADSDTVSRLEGEGRVVFRYAGLNPNGSVNDIAGICSEQGNIVGLMPHPEHAVEAGFGTRGSGGPRSGTDGLRFFTSVLSALVS
ncbi:phosphoribosylformylglycinamidine synthase subunit PurQ [Changpingibacter yushuensis]|uniref:phosphoribosylformylglycinamidine synthase subunit PurQ n=1 Tax=Changpingibacter yushuensis TaxID=2758440 RepID=UPI0015F37502|nr:phosphoribosylformylglycinamidine synthase subunit PurQ [Changpingibacter yushuensis]